MVLLQKATVDNLTLAPKLMCTSVDQRPVVKMLIRPPGHRINVQQRATESHTALPYKSVLVLQIHANRSRHIMFNGVRPDYGIIDMIRIQQCDNLAEELFILHTESDLLQLDTLQILCFQEL